MSATNLTVVETVPSIARTESVSQRVLRLQAQARAMADEHVRELEAAIRNVARLADEIADGGPAYQAGIRELSRRLVEESHSKALTISALLARPH